METLAEPEQDRVSHHKITALTAEIIKACIGHHAVVANVLPALIAVVGMQLAGLGRFRPNRKREY